MQTDIRDPKPQVETLTATFPRFRPGPFPGRIASTPDLPPLRAGSWAFDSFSCSPTALQEAFTQARIESLPEAGVIALNRIAFGPRPGDLDAFRRLGRSDSERLARFVEQQLHPEHIDDTETGNLLRSCGFSTLSKSAAQLWSDHAADHPEHAVRMQPFREVERAVFMRAVSSRRQLAEVLADFWHNHFNVFAADVWTAPLWVAYDRDVIRAHAFGNFRQLLGAVARSAPMLHYTSAYANTRTKPNETFSRALFELHTLGPEAYRGAVERADVPRDPLGRTSGYTDDDIRDAARCLTGWTVRYDTGRTETVLARHDGGTKWILGTVIPAGQPPEHDTADLLDTLAAHPATARHVAHKLCRRFISDDPPARIVEEAARVFRWHLHAPDQLRQVLRVILLSPEFRNTWGQKFKRPFELVVSSMRAVDAKLRLTLDDPASNWFLRAFAQTGLSPFQWRSPKGFPETRDEWIGRSGLASTWRILHWLNDVGSWWGGRYALFDALADTPESCRTAGCVVGFWADRILGRPLHHADREEAIAFLSGGRGADTPFLRREGSDAQRLGNLITLLMLSPQNHLR